MEQKRFIQEKEGKEFWILSNLLNKIGIMVNGNRAWDITVHNKRVAKRVMNSGAMGLGESYIDGDWDSKSVDGFIDRILRARLDRELSSLGLAIHNLKARLPVPSKLRKPWKLHDLIQDLPNDFLEAMLDKRLTFTCGYWGGGAATLEDAILARLDMICKKLELKPGMRLLDMGCGWGSLTAFAAEHYGVECVGVCSLKQQLEWAGKHYSHLPIEFVLRDSLMMDGSFDRIVCINRFEHLPLKNYRVYIEMIAKCLEDDGLFLLQSTGRNERRAKGQRWIDTHILQNGVLPTIAQIGHATDGLFVMEDLHNFGADYDKTLLSWYKNFENAWPDFSEKYGERFYRTWKYYLLCCAGAYRANDMQQWQCIFSKKSVRGVKARRPLA